MSVMIRHWTYLFPRPEDLFMFDQLMLVGLCGFQSVSAGEGGISGYFLYNGVSQRGLV